MTNKQKGNRKELLIKRQYEAAGWVVVKSGASLSPFDLICFKFINGVVDQIHVLQVKTGKAKTLKYNVKREEEAFKQYKNSIARIDFKFVKLHKWERYTI